MSLSLSVLVKRGLARDVSPACPSFKGGVLDSRLEMSGS